MYWCAGVSAMAKHGGSQAISAPTRGDRFSKSWWGEARGAAEDPTVGLSCPLLA